MCSLIRLQSILAYSRVSITCSSKNQQPELFILHPSPQTAPEASQSISTCELSHCRSNINHIIQLLTPTSQYQVVLIEYEVLLYNGWEGVMPHISIETYPSILPKSLQNPTTTIAIFPLLSLSCPQAQDCTQVPRSYAATYHHQTS